MPNNLTLEEHREIAKHLHAIDHHIMKIGRMVGAVFGGVQGLNVPPEIADDLTHVADLVGASTSPSHHSRGSLASKFLDLMTAEVPGSDGDIYFGQYAECVTVAMDAPDKIAE